MRQLPLNFRNRRNTRSNLNNTDIYVHAQHFRLTGVHAPFGIMYISDGCGSVIMLSCKIHVIKVPYGVYMNQ